MIDFLERLSGRFLRFSFYVLFFLTPLIFTPWNYELFEYNKMMLVYALTVIVFGLWLLQSICRKDFKIARTPLDIPIVLFLASQIISTVFSMDPHVSLFGYYSRFNGGLLSTISYIILYYAFVTNIPREKIGRMLGVSILSGAIVALWAFLEHFGHSFSCFAISQFTKFDVSCWVQDVQNRVFATLGQPNWLAAYLTILIPIAIGMGLTAGSTDKQPDSGKNHKSKITNQNYNFKIGGKTYLYFLLSLLFFTTLLFTRSRSGFIAIGITLPLFFISLVFLFKKQILKDLLPIALGLFLVSFIFGVPINQLNRFTLPELSKKSETAIATPVAEPVNTSGSSVIDVGITESGTIRKIVWKGAIDIALHNPLIGTGVETFAYSYYQYRPAEHNMTSEWDFIYNKAHNEYLNFAATTGFLGLGTYSAFIITFIVLCILYIVSCISYKEKREIPNTKYQILNTSLFFAWLSILITNFFGFSVVVIQILFYLIPAIMIVTTVSDLKYRSLKIQGNLGTIATFVQYGFGAVVIGSTISLLYMLAQIWRADVIFAQGYHESRSQDTIQAYQNIRDAINLNSAEPLYYDELSQPASQIAMALYDEKDSTSAAEFARQAIQASNEALLISPSNVNFWKSRTRVFYILAQIDPQYLTDALNALLQAEKLAPTDPKIRYNLALLYEKQKNMDATYRELDAAARLKPDYRDVYLAQALFYSKDKKLKEAQTAVEYILNRIDPNDADAKQILKDLK